MIDGDERRMWFRIISFYILTFLFFGCRDSLIDLHHDGVQVCIFVEGLSNTPSRTITPEHISIGDLGNSNQYTLRMTGTSDMGDRISVANWELNNGMGILRLNPGMWRLNLTVTPVNGAAAVLEGSCLLIVQGVPGKAFITLKPVGGQGTVSVEFILSPELVKKLVSQGATNTVVQVALYNEQNQAVGSTNFSVNATNRSFTYTANNQAVTAEKYTLKLLAPYTGPENRQLTLEWQDVIYIEGSRKTTDVVSLSAEIMGSPNSATPGKKDKASVNITVPSSNGNTDWNTFSGVTITGTQSFNPYGEGLWIYGANWDGEASNDDKLNGTWGNEILFVVWDSVFDAEYYELELLLHPRYGYIGGSAVSNGAKYEKLPVTDADWIDFTSRSPQPRLLKWSGYASSPNYYKIKTYNFNIYERNGSSASRNFTFLAWRDLANNINPTTSTQSGASVRYSFRNGNYAAPYIPAPVNGVTRFKNVDYRIGLEANCNGLAILLNSYTPQHWYGIRVRAVNEFGYGDWVYWKGGKN